MWRAFADEVSGWSLSATHVRDNLIAGVEQAIGCPQWGSSEGIRVLFSRARSASHDSALQLTEHRFRHCNVR